MAELCVFVVSAWAGDEKFANTGTVKVAEARFVDTPQHLIFNFVNRAGLFNQVAVSQAPPIHRTFRASPNSRPVLLSEVLGHRKVILSTVPPLASGADESCMQSGLFVGFPIFGWNWQIDRRLPALQVLFKENNLRWSLPAIKEAHGETNGGIHPFPAHSYYDSDKHPRTLGVDDGLGVEFSGLGTYCGGIGCASGFPGLPADYSERNYPNEHQSVFRREITPWRFFLGAICWFCVLPNLYFAKRGSQALFGNALLAACGMLIWFS
jgi:hypothetical protein